MQEATDAADKESSVLQASSKDAEADQAAAQLSTAVETTGKSGGSMSTRSGASRAAANTRATTAAATTGRGRPSTRGKAAASQPHSASASRVPAQSSTPFASIISELSPEGQGRMQQLLGLLQGSGISTDAFMAESKKVLSERQYRRMEEIRNEVRKDAASSARASPVQSPTPSAPGSQLGSPVLPTSGLPLSMSERASATGQASKLKKRQADAESGDGSAAMALLAAVAAKKPKLETSGNFAMPSGPPSATMKQALASSTKDIVLPSPIKNLSGHGGKPIVPAGYASRLLAVPGGGSGATSTSGGGTSGGGAASNEKLDVDALTDVMGYAGIDLREEYENILRDEAQQLGAAGVGGSLVDRSRTQDFINTDSLRIKMEQIGQSAGIRRPSNEVLNYLALGVQQRLRGLVHEMVAASKHRAFSQALAPPPLDEETGRPLYAIKVHQDVKRQLQAMEQVERHLEEKRKESLRPFTQDADADEAGLGDGTDAAALALMETPKPAKRKAKKTKSVSERNLSEDVRKRITNETAMRSAGGKMKSWMLAGMEAISTTTPSKSIGDAGDMAAAPGATPAAAPATPSATAAKAAKADTVTPLHRLKPGAAEKARASAAADMSSSARPVAMQALPYGARRITVRDAVFCLEQERSARGIGRRSLLKSLAQRLN
ncbi:transcription initiation factor TFIID component TAF4 family-domain-containing protein [Thamnocephalis sphaerospora]|uniref:Transcription initiation factor TFIID subunit 4 n=1 Tax=Thamnocephalis sphaerospora TaxID=78915 RepID=A0A4P9XI45_9FUNG|nr:transcription initiation factor TFIID component TAF4 family-domain-containing protein [Thamnocephalis sphaerospora]|eukprot:RKP04920.1 transcription initiation factor TFIID component TAF4 family-domain-containing protein [Thamnocephalis sphaerospora]